MKKKANENAPHPHSIIIISGYYILYPLDAEGELNTDVDLAGHLDDLGELDGLLGSALEVLDGEDLESGLVDLESGI